MHLSLFLSHFHPSLIISTIPIAKRRYYGRVQQAVHEFLEMGKDVVKADMVSAAALCSGCLQREQRTQTDCSSQCSHYDFS